MGDRIYLSPPWQSGDEAEAVERAIRSNWLAPLGPEVDAFEADLAAYVGTAAAHAVSSGTAALHLALRSVGVMPGDVVFAPSLTFIGSVGPILYVGAEPWFIDSEPGSWNIDPALLEEALAVSAGEGRRVGAVISVDLFGQCAAYETIELLCEQYGVPLIEDAAEALGSSRSDRSAGSFGRVGILSFNGNKIITTSGGGAVVSNDVDLVDRCRHLSAQAREPEIHYEHRAVGYNYRMSNLLAAVGRAQLATIDDRVSARRAVFDAYCRRLGHLPGVAFMDEDPLNRSNRWLTTLTIDPDVFGASNIDVIRRLEANDIEARPLWKPMHLQPVFEGVVATGGEVAERLYATGLCLPSGTGLKPDEIERVASLVASTPR